MIPLWLHKRLVAKQHRQSVRLLDALKAEIREHNEDVLRLTHELDIALDGNRRLIDCLVRNRLEIP